MIQATSEFENAVGRSIGLATCCEDDDEDVTHEYGSLLEITVARFRKQNLVPFRITGLHDQVVWDSVTNAYGAVYEILISKGLSTAVLDENEITVCIDDERLISGPSCGLAVSVAIYSLALSQAPKKRFGITGKISTSRP